jgi:hypothetical protein
VLYLLIAVGICLLVPWLPVVLLRLAPVRPVPPLSAEEMDRLIVQLNPKRTVSATRTQPVGPNQQAVTVPRQRERQPDRADADTPPPQNRSPATRRESDRGLDRLTLRSYQWVNLVILPVFIVTMLGMGIGWAMLFNYLGDEHARTFPPGVFVFKPAVYWAIFGVPSVFLGIFGCTAILEPLTRILLGRRYPEYCYWEQARRGLAGPVGVQRYGRRFVLFAVVLGSLMALWMVLAMNWYVRLTENEIAIKPLFVIGEQLHPYNRVQQIVLTTHTRVKQDVIPREGLHLRFDDGQIWSTGQSFRLPDTPEERKRLLEFLCRKTGKPLTQAKLLDNVPGW